MRWQVGDVVITQIVEMTNAVPLTGMLPDATNAELEPHRSWMHPHFLDDDDRLLLSMHALVVESEGHRIVVDTCIGNDKPRPYPGMSELQTRFLDDLESAGFPPSSIDTVLCTHLHFDHVGWNTTLLDDRWVPTFPNARYLFGRIELEHWREADDPGAEVATVSFADSVQPILDAGLAKLVESDHRLTGEVRLQPTPGHSPGHHSVVIESGTERAVITGDVVHSPIQFARTDWGASADFDRERAAVTRQAFRDQYGNSDVLVIGTHFPAPTAGYLTWSSGDWCFAIASENRHRFAHLSTPPPFG